MRSEIVESGFNTNIPERREDIGFEAEEVVVQFFQTIPQMDIRYSTETEDSGRKQIVQDQQLDAVAYLDGHPAMGLQITTAMDPDLRAEKMRQIKARPFLRLNEMKKTDMAIPRVLVFLDPKHVEEFGTDHDFSKHPQVGDQILKSAINSLKFDIAMTKNLQEQEAIKSLILMLESERKKANLN